MSNTTSNAVSEYFLCLNSGRQFSKYIDSAKAKLQVKIILSYCACVFTF